MLLAEGSYIIFVVEADLPETDVPIGHYRVEDRSLNPKPVLRLAPGTQPPRWVVQKAKDAGGFLLKIDGGALVLDENGRVFAQLMDERPSVVWNVEPSSEVNAYAISCNKGYLAVDKRTPNSQLVVKKDGLKHIWKVFPLQ